MVTLAVRTLRGGSEAAVENWAQVSTLRARGVGATVFGPGMLKGAEGADGMVNTAPLLHVTEVPAVPALGDWGGRIRLLDLAGAAEEV